MVSIPHGFRCRSEELYELELLSVTGGMVVPECYCVDECYMDRERANPNSTELYPINPQEFGHHLWSNAIYIILLLIRTF